MADSKSKTKENPYLSHLPPSERVGIKADGSDGPTKEPLYGFLPRKVNGDQVRKAMVSFMVGFRGL